MHIASVTNEDSRQAWTPPFTPIFAFLLLLGVGCAGPGASEERLVEAPTARPEATAMPVDTATATPSPGPTQAPVETDPTPLPESTSTPTGQEPSATVELEISARSLQFDEDVLGPVPAGASVVLTFHNQEPLPHNVAVYDSGDMTTALFSGEVLLGPETVVYEFQAPNEPGEYVFVCEPHPGRMVGTFLVEAAEE